MAGKAQRLKAIASRTMQLEPLHASDERFQIECNTAVETGLEEITGLNAKGEKLVRRYRYVVVYTWRGRWLQLVDAVYPAP